MARMALDNARHVFATDLHQALPPDAEERIKLLPLLVKLGDPSSDPTPLRRAITHALKDTLGSAEEVAGVANVVAGLTGDQLENRVHIFQEEGGATLLRSADGLPPSVLVEMLLMVASGLFGANYQAEYCHRDLHGNNVLMRWDHHSKERFTHCVSVCSTWRSSCHLKGGIR